MGWFNETPIFPPGGGERANGQHPGQLPGDVPKWEQRFEYDNGTEVLGPDGNYYRCIEDHIASEVFANDLAALKWVMFAGPGMVVDDQQIVFDGDGVTLRLRNGTGPDSTVDMTPFVNPPIKSGFVDTDGWAGNPKKKTVTFATAFTDANYAPNAINTETDNFNITVEDILPGSFVLNLNSNVAPSNNVEWTAIKHGEY